MYFMYWFLLRLVFLLTLLDISQNMCKKSCEGVGSHFIELVSIFDLHLLFDNFKLVKSCHMNEENCQASLGSWRFCKEFKPFRWRWSRWVRMLP